MENNEFYCPVFEGNITRYDCDELTCGLDLGKFINDGLPPLMSIDALKSKADICNSCERNHIKNKRV